MKAAMENAYPKLETVFPYKVLSRWYQPSDNELLLSNKFQNPLHKLGFLIQLKLLQRLGYFILPSDCPQPIIDHIKSISGIVLTPKKSDWKTYESSGTRQRHLDSIREYIGIKPFTGADRPWLKDVAYHAAQTKETVADIINVMLEELTHHCFEIPGLSLLQSLAGSARRQVNEGYYEKIFTSLSKSTKGALDQLWQLNSNGIYSHWQLLKREPKKPTNKEIRSYLQHVEWLRHLESQMPVLDLPVAKFQQFMLEARALDAKEMRELHPKKRYALAVILIRSQHGKALDDVADLFIKLVRGLENSAQQSLQQFILQKQKQADELITNFKDVVLALDKPGDASSRLAHIEQLLHPDKETVLAKCNEHLAYAGNNYLPFMLRPYGGKRSLLYNCLSILTLKSTSSDKTTERLIRCLLSIRDNRQEHISKHYLLDQFNGTKATKWITNTWKKLVLIQAENEDEVVVLHRKYLELCIMVHIKQELMSVDLYVAQSEQYKDYREGIVDDETYERELPLYAQQVGLPLTEPKRFIAELKHKLKTLAAQVDERFPDNAHAAIVDGKLTLKRAKTVRSSEAIQQLDDAITEQLETTSIVDILVDAEHWLGLSDLFYPLSGNRSRLEDQPQRFVTTLFCYGCNLGPTQTARSMKGMTPKQVAWLNLKQVTEDRLDKSLTKVINAYNQFELPKFWGSGKHASVDGSKWELNEQNLMSEYHIRYGGYGGIGYYHVSDTYIALYCRFITCGSYEGNYLLDGLMKNESDIKPEFLHGDTQSQSYPVFGLSYLLGIGLMPRIRNIQDLNLFRAENDCKYQNIDKLFNGSINFTLIENLLPDMLKLIISIKLGKMPASSLLRRLNTYSRKNKLYFAFRELGKVIRTLFLLNYIDNYELRQVIQAETNKSEEFNNFVKWFFFGGEGVIAENIRHEQSKVVKYNQLVANMAILYNTDKMTCILRDMANTGHEITPELLAGLSPYRTAHINRFGDYLLDMERSYGPLNFPMSITY
ncbi:MAG: Tn3 family transposase [Shewanella sp.]